jgi:arylsulfatase A
MLTRLLLTFLLGFALPSLAEDRPPNIVFMLIDDMGGTDLGCYGSQYYETPHIDQLAKDGIKFTQAYSACTVCSPSRAAILTGKAPARLHLTDWITGQERPFARLSIPKWQMYLSVDEETIAERLQTKGYTTANIGKWHLGDSSHRPQDHGFDVNIGGTEQGSPPSYFSPYKIATLPDGPEGEFLPDRLTTEAIQFIQKNKDRPFFLYFPHYAVHTPIMGKEEVIAKYRAKPGTPGHNNPVYAALVESVDDSVGRLRQTLKELNLSENTLFIFTSDNGGLSNQVNASGWKRGPTDNSPARLGKGGPYNGGVSIPLLMSWPAKIAPGSTTETPVISYDHLPTLLAATQTPLKAGQITDGESLLPLITQQGQLKRDAIYWHYPHYHQGSSTPYSAIRDGNWKLLHFFEDDRLELYDLSRDPGEMDNLAPLQPELTQRLLKRLQDWRAEVSAQLPTSNPNYDPVRTWEANRKNRNTPGKTKKKAH